MRSVLKTVRHVFVAVSLSSALLLASACGSDGGSKSGGPAMESASGEGVDEGDPVHGDVLVMWKNLNPANPPAAAGLVNESSEIGQKLKSGKANSSEVRVLSDAQMGGLLAALEKNGFFQYATDGMGLDSIPDAPGRKAVIIVTQDGRSRGLLSLPGTGASPIPKVFYNSKMLIIGIHSQLPGAEVRAGLGEPDERVFTAPPPKFHKP
jgi:hypothetical protein